VRSELEPRECVHGHRVRLDAVDLTEEGPRPVSSQERAYPFADPWQVGTGDRAADDEGDRM
jgi:hypothetical protein